MIKRIDIENELNEISPETARLLSDLPGQSVPQGYFDTLEAQIMAQVRVQAALDQLDDISNAPGEDYFSSLEDRVLNAIHLEAQVGKYRKIKVLNIVSFLKYAAIALVILGSAILIKYNLAQKEDDMPVFDQAYLEYLKKNIDDVDLQMLIQTDVANDGILNEMPSYPDIRHEDNVFDHDH